MERIFVMVPSLFYKSQEYCYDRGKFYILLDRSTVIRVERKQIFWSCTFLFTSYGFHMTKSVILFPNLLMGPKSQWTCANWSRAHKVV